MSVLLGSIGVFWLVVVARTVAPWRLSPQIVLGLLSFSAAVIAAIYEETVKEWLITWLAIGGGSTVLLEISDALTTYADERRTAVEQFLLRRRRI